MRLVRWAEENRRQTRFADAEPLLVISQESFDLLNSKADKTFSPYRFRPNIVVQSGQAHAEDNWLGFKIGPLSLTAVKLCTRCKVIQVDPMTGKESEEPLKTLMEYRKVDEKVSFGRYFAAVAPGQIRVGDSFQTL